MLSTLPEIPNKFLNSTKRLILAAKLRAEPEIIDVSLTMTNKNFKLQGRIWINLKEIECPGKRDHTLLQVKTRLS